MTPRISYSVPEAADAVGLSESAIRAALRDGDLNPHYPTGGKPLILHDDLMAWVVNAPTQRRSA